MPAPYLAATPVARTFWRALGYNGYTAVVPPDAFVPALPQVTAAGSNAFHLYLRCSACQPLILPQLLPVLRFTVRIPYRLPGNGQPTSGRLRFHY